MSSVEPGMANRLPGDPSPAQAIERMIRVDHAGEYGAKRIYDGQLAVLGQSAAAPSIRRMAEQEENHLRAFDQLIVERRVRPTLLSPLWHIAGFALGAGTALLGPKAAMACTEAVEEVIDAHYARQASALGSEEAELKATIEEFRTHEIEHRDAARAEGAKDAPAYALLTNAVKAGSRLAIWLSERL
jgi:ubiquinone biosynthesis monooxygenase Coq7